MFGGTFQLKGYEEFLAPHFLMDPIRKYLWFERGIRWTGSLELGRFHCGVQLVFDIFLQELFCSGKIKDGFSAMIVSLSGIEEAVTSQCQLIPKSSF